MEHEPLTLLNLAGGGIVERFQDALEEVLENISDVNTDPKATRAITIKVTFKPRDDDRDFGDISFDCSPSLAPPRKVHTQAWFGRDGKRYVAVENNPRQPGLFKQDPEHPGKVIPADFDRKEQSQNE